MRLWVLHLSPGSKCIELEEMGKETLHSKSAKSLFHGNSDSETLQQNKTKQRKPTPASSLLQFRNIVHIQIDHKNLKKKKNPTCTNEKTGNFIH